MKKLFSLLAGLLMAAAGYAQSGTTGDLTWEFNPTDSSLTISGNGAMPDCNRDSQPWYSYRSSIKSVVIAEGVTTIGNYAFSDCSGLTSVNIPSSVITIGYNAFYFCSGLTSVTISNGVTTIGSAVFADCSNLNSISIPSSVTSIGGEVFSGCSNLTAIEVAVKNPNYASQDGVLFNKNKNTLEMCPAGKIGAYTIPSGVTAIAKSAFSGCSSLTSITIPSSVITIGAQAFSDCSGLTSVSIPSNVTTVGSYAFYRCNGLTSVTIPSSVTTIRNQAFDYCSSLTEVVVLNPQPVIFTITSYIFSGVNKNACILKVPAESVSLYKAAIEWMDFTNIEGIATYTVSFDAQEGSEVAPQTLLPSSMAMQPTAPTRAGYTFGGWYTEAACTNAWNFAADMVTSDITLYAKWTAESSEPISPTAVAANELLPLTLYPTVTNGELIIENGEWGASEAMSHIEIYSMSGALVAKVPTTGKQTTINLSQLTSGTYVVRAGKYVGKVVKQ